MSTRQTVLIVEDKIINRKILKKILSEEYTILEAENGAIAWEILQERREEISGVLLDIVMPVMDGFGVLSKIKEARIADLPILVTTGAADEDTEQRALEAGAWDYVTKPYNAKVLTSRLKNAIGRSQVAAFEKLKYLSEHDELTGLYNRHKLFEETRKMLNKNPDIPFAFLRLDIDHFSLFNSFFGEEEGNLLLKYFAKCIKDIFSNFDHCVYGRISADIYCICFEYDGINDKLISLLQFLKNNLATFKNDFSISLSVGICEVYDKELSIDDLYFRTTVAAQNCKDQYEKFYAVYDAASGRQIENEIEISNEMEKALEEKQFVVYLQSKFNLSTETPCGAEALVRWMHPEKGLISPGLFIPVFEKNGFITKVDYFVWEETCRLIRNWLDEGKNVYPISVNISRISLYNPNLVDLISDLVDKYNIPPELLQLEITESAYMTNQKLMEKMIGSLHDAGFTILMDDFGSDYSSLNSLKEIDVDVLKVDMNFLPKDGDLERGEIILASVIKMANWLGMNVIVEGVETRLQRDFIEGAGCNCVQGFYYARPINSNEYEEKYINFYENSSVSDSNENIDYSVQHNMTILIIDDSEIDRAILVENLKEFYHIKECQSAEEGLAYLKNNMRRVRLILVDNVMPGMSGMEFLSYCQHDTALASIPKIMITANDCNEDQVEAFNEGAYDYITKPLVKEVAVARVKHVMEIICRTPIFDSMERGYIKSGDLDVSTQLLNKISFNSIVSRVLESLPEELMSLMIIDIENMDSISSENAIEDVDKIFKTVGNELKNVFRKSDIIGRISKNRFAVLMTKIPNQEISKRKASEFFKTVIFRCSNEVHIEINISIGISFRQFGDTYDELYGYAEEALNVAEEDGGGQTVVYGEKVPEIIDDGKPIILICSENIQLYPSIALSYGDDVAFAHITSFDELKETFNKYEARICMICLDMKKSILEDSNEFYQYIIKNGGGDRVAIVAICAEGDMDMLKAALKLNISDIITTPPQVDTIRRRLSQIILKNSNTEK